MRKEIADRLKRCAFEVAVCGYSQRPFCPLLFSGPRSAPSLPARIAGKTNENWVGRPLPYSNSNRLGVTFGRACVRSPRPCRRRLTKRFVSGLFAGQFLIGESLPNDLRQGFGEPTTIIGLAVVVPESLFVQVADQVERFAA